VRGYDVPADKNNFQPRLGLAWDPTGGGHTIVRGGIGLYSQQHLLYHINRVQLEGPGGSPVLTLVPGSPLMPVFPATLPSSIAVFPPRDIQVVDPAFGNPYSLQGSLGFERLIANTLVGVDYVYLNGRALMSLVDTNAPASVLKPANRTVAAADATRPMAPVPNGYRKIIELGNEGESWYHGLQVKVNRAIGPFRTLASYTWASAKDRANYLLPEDSRNLSAEKGRSDNDIRHNLSAGLTWDLPGRGPVSRGWTLSGLGLFRSGRPYNVTWGDDRNGTSQNDARPGERNTAEGQGFMSVDLAAARRLTLRRGGLELRGEMFNVLSRTNYDEYVGVRLSRSFGMPVSAFPRRRLQLAVIARF
jgi:hypothetical protein